MEFQNKIYTVIGATGSGKTPFIVGGEFEEGLASIFKKKNMSTLVIDEIEHVKYSHAPILQPNKDLRKRLNEQIGIYRCLAPMQYMRELLLKIVTEKLVWNTLLVLEDSSKYIPQSFEYLEKALIGNSKQQNVDIVFMYWNWGQVPPDILRMTKYFIIFRTPDSPECRQKYISSCYADCLEAYKRVTSKKPPRPYYIVETGI